MELCLGAKDPGRFLTRQPLLLDQPIFGSTHIMGSSGEGKSTLLGRLAHFFHQAGDGVLLIDPARDLAEDLVQRIDDPTQLIYCEPAALQRRYWTLNPFVIDTRRLLPERQIDIIADSVVQMFEHIGRADLSFMTLVRLYLKQMVRLVFAEPPATLAKVILAFISPSYRDALIARNKHEATAIFWHHNHTQLTEYTQTTEMQSTLRRLWEFLQSDIIYNWIGHAESTFQLADWLSQGKIVICNWRYLADDVAELLGNLIMAQVLSEYKMRDEEDRIGHPWRIMVDEFHVYSPEPYGTVITDGRKYGVYPVVAHQNFSQLKDNGLFKLANAVKQCWVKLYFYTSSADWKELTEEYGPEIATTIRRLRRYDTLAIYRTARGTKSCAVALNNWDTPAVPARLADARARQIALTRPVARTAPDALPSLMDQFGRWLAEDEAAANATPKRGTRKTHDIIGRLYRPTIARAKAPGPLTPPPTVQPNLPAGSNSKLGSDAGEPGPVPVPDERPSSPVILPGPTYDPGQAAQPRRRPKSGQ